ncbi:Protein N-terminal and lysine N-methyltransferase efm7 [Coemansia pectinata]|uniref:Protein N-terminal and lysine N-methyltransferase EFM7 n=1 Tax=Coemansia pectinata TaxID=1052879 RepID=A0A9W8GV70_9FUNG|nr:Protein N-terminal and lysine N-methyltransferase efm7 [Coemansia pectinata]
MSSSRNSEEMDNDFNLFQEPEDYYPPEPEDKVEVFERNPKWVTVGTPSQITVNLLGAHPLWGHYLWNAAKVFANYLDERKHIVQGKSVLELGAAGALPSLVSACNGASRVVITDYPDHDLVENIRRNVKANVPADKIAEGLVTVEGFKWGYDIEKIAELSTQNGAFDVLILSDLVFNHSEHSALLRSVDRLMAKPQKDGSGGGEAYVFFTHHRPWLADKDMNFLTRAHDELGLVVTRLVEDYTGAMFDSDPGDERVRGTVHGFCLTFPPPSLQS